MSSRSRGSGSLGRRASWRSSTGDGDRADPVDGLDQGGRPRPVFVQAQVLASVGARDACGDGEPVTPGLGFGRSEWPGQGEGLVQVSGSRASSTVWVTERDGK
jgi:hypothetical protein